jgi:hypothetical protein
MLRFMLPTLFAARVTNVSAQRTYRLGVLAATRHRCGSKLAGRRAIYVKGDALFHHLDVVLFQTSRHAMVACGSATVAGFDAGGIDLV